MKYEIVNMLPPEKVEKVIRLALKQLSSGGVALVALDKRGDVYDGGYLLTLTTDGAFCRQPVVNADLGFRLDRAGSVALL